MPFEVGAGSYRPKDLLDGLRLSLDAYAATPRQVQVAT